MSQRYEWDRKAQGQGPRTQHSGPCTQLAARFRDGSPKSVEAGWGFPLGEWTLSPLQHEEGIQQAAA